MKEQQQPITEDEWVLRRVHKDCFIAFEPPRINSYAFKPQVAGRFPDTTGISFYRQACVAHDSDVLAKTDVSKRDKYGIVRLPVAFLASLDLLLQRDDDTEEPVVLGHVIMPGINSVDYEREKDIVLPKMKALSDYVNAHLEFLMLPAPR